MSAATITSEPRGSLTAAERRSSCLLPISHTQPRRCQRLLPILGSDSRCNSRYIARNIHSFQEVSTTNGSGSHLTYLGNSLGKGEDMDSGTDKVELPNVRERLTQTEQALERSERLAISGRFAAVVIHEINNPLEAIANLAFLLKTQPLSDEGLRFVQMMEEQLLRISTITRQTLRFNRTAERPLSADLVELIRIAVRTYSRGISEKQLKLELDLPSFAVCEVYPGELTQAVSNLISNAIDASELGGRLQIRLRSRLASFFITVCDSGSGVPETMRNVIFDAFATGKESGNGLGLWICRRIVEKHGGHILWRTSTRPERHGTAFRISLDNSISRLHLVQ
jgi:signal transduction histidine kinase